MIVSCGKLKEDLVKVTISKEINETVTVPIPKTSTAVSAEKAKKINIRDYVDKAISSIKVEKASIKVKNFTGNPKAVINSLSISIDGKEVAKLTNVKPSIISTLGTINLDKSKLAILENSLNSDKSTTFKAAAKAMSNEGKANFDLDFSLKLKVTVSDK